MVVTKYSMDEYAAMNATQRKRLSKDELNLLLDTQIGQPQLLPEDILRNIIKDTIERTIEEKIPDNFTQMIKDMKEDFSKQTEELANENKMLKKTILEQKFLEGVRRDKTKNNILENLF